MPDTDQIFITDLILSLSVGIYEHEKIQKQRVVFNITLDVESNKGSDFTSIKKVVSYEEVFHAICEIAEAKHYELLEELAEDIAVYCLRDQRVKKACIKIEKPDIIKEVRSVGIEIIRGSCS